MSFHGWAPDDYNLSGFLGPKERAFFQGDLWSSAFTWDRGDKPHKFGWEVFDYLSNEFVFQVSLTGAVRCPKTGQHVGDVRDPLIGDVMRSFMASSTRIELYHPSRDSNDCWVRLSLASGHVFEHETLTDWEQGQRLIARMRRVEAQGTTLDLEFLHAPDHSNYLQIRDSENSNLRIDNNSHTYQ